MIFPLISPFSLGMFQLPCLITNRVHHIPHFCRCIPQSRETSPSPAAPGLPSPPSAKWSTLEGRLLGILHSSRASQYLQGMKGPVVWISAGMMMDDIQPLVNMQKAIEYGHFSWFTCYLWKMVIFQFAMQTLTREYQIWDTAMGWLRDSLSNCGWPIVPKNWLANWLANRVPHDISVIPAAGFTIWPINRLVCWFFRPSRAAE